MSFGQANSFPSGEVVDPPLWAETDEERLEEHHGQRKNPKQRFEIDGPVESGHPGCRGRHIFGFDGTTDPFPGRTGDRSSDDKHGDHRPQRNISGHGSIGDPRGEMHQPYPGGESPQTRDDPKRLRPTHPFDEERSTFGVSHRGPYVAWDQKLVTEPCRSQ